MAVKLITDFHVEELPDIGNGGPLLPWLISFNKVLSYVVSLTNLNATFHTRVQRPSQVSK